MSVTDETVPPDAGGGDGGSGDDPGAPRRRSNAARNAAIVVGVVLVGLIALLATRGTSQDLESNIVGQAAPDFVGQTTDGESFRLSAHRGEWVLVNFFATWCTECIIEHPQLQQIDQELGGEGVQLVSVSFSDDAAKVRTFFESKGDDWPVLTEDTGRVALDYGVSKVPETYVVAPSGVVVARLIGVTATEVEQIIDQSGVDASAGSGANGG
ncbi:MAG TPA: TlpA disulfide reductase family protein [Acidimicrobiales bacterium]